MPEPPLPPRPASPPDTAPDAYEMLVDAPNWSHVRAVEYREATLDQLRHLSILHADQDSYDWVNGNARMPVFWLPGTGEDVEPQWFPIPNTKIPPEVNDEDALRKFGRTVEAWASRSQQVDTNVAVPAEQQEKAASKGKKRKSTQEDLGCGSRRAARARVNPIVELSSGHDEPVIMDGDEEARTGRTPATSQSDAPTLDLTHTAAGPPLSAGDDDPSDKSAKTSDSTHSPGQALGRFFELKGRIEQVTNSSKPDLLVHCDLGRQFHQEIIELLVDGNVALFHKHAEIIKTNEQLREKLRRAETELEASRQRNDNLATREVILQNDLERLGADGQVANAKLQAIRTENDQLLEERAANLASMEQLRHSLQEERSYREELREENNRLSARQVIDLQTIEDLRGSLQQATSELEALQEKKDRLVTDEAARSSRLTFELRNTKQEKEVLVAEMAAKTTELDQLQGAHRLLRELYEESCEQRINLSMQKAQEAKKAEELAKDNSELRTMVADLERRTSRDVDGAHNSSDGFCEAE